MRMGRGDMQSMCGDIIPGALPKHHSRAVHEPGVFVGVRRAPAEAVAVMAKKAEAAKVAITKKVTDASSNGAVSSLSRGTRIMWVGRFCWVSWL